MVKSTHQLFKEYLLSEELLSPVQEHLLQEHLRECAECRQQEAAWSDVQRLMQAAPLASPALGFTNRWQDKLAAQRLKAQRRRTWLFFGISIGLALVLSAVLIFGTLQIVFSPLKLLSQAIYFLVVMFSYYRQVSHFLGNISIAVPFLSITGLVFFTGFVSFLSVLWAVAYRKLSSARRIIS